MEVLTEMPRPHAFPPSRMETRSMAKPTPSARKPLGAVDSNIKPMDTASDAMKNLFKAVAEGIAGMAAGLSEVPVKAAETMRQTIDAAAEKMAVPAPIPEEAPEAPAGAPPMPPPAAPSMKAAAGAPTAAKADAKPKGAAPQNPAQKAEAARKAEEARKKKEQADIREQWERKRKAEEEKAAAAKKAAAEEAAERQKKRQEAEAAAAKEKASTKPPPTGGAGAKPAPKPGAKPAGAKPAGAAGAKPAGAGPKPAGAGAGPKPAPKPAAKPAAAKPAAKKALTKKERAMTELAKVEEHLKKGDVQMAKQELAKVRQLANDNPDLVANGLTEEALTQMQQTIDTMPDAAVHVLKYAFKSPFTAIGIPRVAAARVLNTVNKREMLKKFRKLAVQLHPDKCEHPIALPAMQALNAAYDKTQWVNGVDPNKPKPTKTPPKAGPKKK